MLTLAVVAKEQDKLGRDAGDVNVLKTAESNLSRSESIV